MKKSVLITLIVAGALAVTIGIGSIVNGAFSYVEKQRDVQRQEYQQYVDELRERALQNIDDAMNESNPFFEGSENN